MSAKAHFINICCFVRGGDSDFEVSDSSRDEWLPDPSAIASDEVQAMVQKKARKAKKTRVRQETTAKPSTNKASSDSGDNDDETLTSIGRAILAKDHLPRSVLAAADCEDGILLLAELMAVIENQELDEDLTSILAKPNWTDIPFQAPSVPFKGNFESAPADGRLKTPYKLFHQFAT